MENRLYIPRHECMVDNSKNKQEFVLQDWVGKLNLKQQTGLISAIRGFDGYEEDTVGCSRKDITRMIRGIVLRNADNNTKFMSKRPLEKETVINTLVEISKYNYHWHWLNHIVMAMDTIALYHNNEYVKLYYQEICNAYADIIDPVDNTIPDGNSKFHDLEKQKEHDYSPKFNASEIVDRSQFKDLKDDMPMSNGIGGTTVWTLGTMYKDTIVDVNIESNMKVVNEEADNYNLKVIVGDVGVKHTVENSENGVLSNLAVRLEDVKTLNKGYTVTGNLTTLHPTNAVISHDDAVKLTNVVAESIVNTFQPKSIDLTQDGINNYPYAIETSSDDYVTQEDLDFLEDAIALTPTSRLCTEHMILLFTALATTGIKTTLDVHKDILTKMGYTWGPEGLQKALDDNVLTRGIYCRFNISTKWLTRSMLLHYINTIGKYNKDFITAANALRNRFRINYGK